MNEKTFLNAFNSAKACFEIARAENGYKPDPEVAGQELAEILLSRPLDMDEQWFLAQFFLGATHKHKSPGQPKIKPSSEIVQAVARHYTARVAVGHKKMAIYQEIEERFGIKKSTIYEYLDLVGKKNWTKQPKQSLVDYCKAEVEAWERSKLSDE